jgi:hypothetical protein
VAQATEIAQLHIVSPRGTHLRYPVNASKGIEFVYVVVSADSSKIIYPRINLMKPLTGNGFRRPGRSFVMRPKSRFCPHASAAILHAGRGDFSQLATAVVVATIGIKRSVAVADSVRR